MTPVTQHSVKNTSIIPKNTSIIPGAAFTVKSKNCLTRCRVSRHAGKHALSSERLILPLATSFKLLPQHAWGYPLYKRFGHHELLATGTNVALEESSSPAPNEIPNEDSEVQSDVLETSEGSPANPNSSPASPQTKKTRPVRKSEMPPVKNEELIPGATFTGKVRSIQPFGAFVDFGAFTEGLVHVSRLSNSFVKDVADFVSVGQEVKVTLVEVNYETERISLSMRETEDTSQRQQRKDGRATADRARPNKKSSLKSSQKKEEVKSSKFVKGQELEGTVKNLTRSGTFISLPGGEEGFLPHSEESDGGLVSMMGGSSLQVGQEVKVRVLRINRGQVTLTMKEEGNDDKLDSQLTQGIVHIATNPFVLAFRENKDIAAFLDQREEMEKSAQDLVTIKTSEVLEGKPTQAGDVGYTVNDSEDQPASGITDVTRVAPASEEMVKEETYSGKTDNIFGVTNNGEEFTENVMEEVSKSLSSEDAVSSENQITEEAPSAVVSESDNVSGFSAEVADQIVSSENLAGDETSNVYNVTDKGEEFTENVTEEVSKSLSTEDTVSGENQISGQAPSTVVSETDNASSFSAQVADKIISPEKQAGNGDVTHHTEDTIVEEQVQTPATAPIEGNGEGRIPDRNGSIVSSEKGENSGNDGLLQQSSDQLKSPESNVIEVQESQTDGTENKVLAEVTASDSGTSSIPQTTEVETTPQNSGTVTNSNGSTSKESTVKAAISPALVKQLREETGAGMMDCKKALSETGGDLVKAQEYLRKKGLASAEKKASRATAEGRIGSYIHDSRIGVLVEVNCETDFVSRGGIFEELVDDLAMQVAACPQVQYLVTEDVPDEVVSKEKEIEMQKEDLLSKSEQIRSRIVEGRTRKRLEELALLEQPYIKNDKMVVKDLVKQTIATIGENIKVKRFVRYNLGEGLEKKKQDFAAEVAAQTAAKPATVSEKDEPASAEVQETVQKPSTATISAALVKQLREETGAGMMDCKKALSETGGDLEKAQEYLRKKGLASADKKSSRLAAEGRIGSYIHDSRIGVLIEVNCETDFVGRSEKFKDLVDDLAMQVVACPQVQFVSTENIPENIVHKEKELEMQREDLQSKPENIRERIVEGRVSKRLGELALLEQPFIKDDSLLVKDLVKQTVAALGENIKVRRFVRFTLGETIANLKEDQKNEKSHV